jgi:hypothetical protein
MTGEQLRTVSYSTASEERLRLWEIAHNKTFETVRVAPLRGFGDPDSDQHRGGIRSGDRGGPERDELPDNNAR